MEQDQFIDELANYEDVTPAIPQFEPDGFIDRNELSIPQQEVQEGVHEFIDALHTPSNSDMSDTPNMIAHLLLYNHHSGILKILSHIAVLYNERQFPDDVAPALSEARKYQEDLEAKQEPLNAPELKNYAACQKFLVTYAPDMVSSDPPEKILTEMKQEFDEKFEDGELWSYYHGWHLVLETAANIALCFPDRFEGVVDTDKLWSKVKNKMEEQQMKERIVKTRAWHVEPSFGVLENMQTVCAGRIRELSYFDKLYDGLLYSLQEDIAEFREGGGR